MDHIIRPLAHTHHCELLVVGSGVAGMTAALQAARLGLDTILIEKESVLGGNSGPLLGIHWGGAHIYHDYAAETGIVMEMEEEIAFRGGKHRTPDHHYNICRLAEAIWQEKLEAAGVRVLKRHVAREAEVAGDAVSSVGRGPVPRREGVDATDGAVQARALQSDTRRVTGVIADDIALGETVRFEVSHAVLDASGDGQVAFSAGASFRMGRESQAEFDERSAPEVADDHVAGVSITALVRRSETPIEFLPPGNVFDVPLNTKAGGWMQPTDNVRMLWPTEEAGTLQNPLSDEHEIYERLLKQFYHYWAEVKKEPKYADWELIWVSPIAGKREMRRFIGDVVVTQTELETPAALPDRLGYGGFTIDQHEQGADGVNRIFMYSAPPLYDTCYRMTYSRDFDNLYLAGRLISSTHMAHGSTRIIKTGGLLAQGTAIAIALAKQHHCSARAVYEQHLPQLQQEFLRLDGSIIDFPAEDERDVASAAQVSACSEWLYEDLAATEMLPLEGLAGTALYAWPDRLNSVRAYVSNPGEDPLPLALRVCHATNSPPELLPRPSDAEAGFFHHLFKVEERISQLCELARVEAAVPPGFEGWLDIPLQTSLDLPQRSRQYRQQAIALVLEGSGLSIGRDPSYCDVAQTMVFAATGFSLSEGRLALLPDQIVPLGQAAQVSNGLNRRFGRAPLNMWVSKPGEPL
ncbi:MAG: FAD-dependent oxidoreductase, partial [Bacteroidota bacterium]